jgi:hypothetical protein
MFAKEEESIYGSSAIKRDWQEAWDKADAYY